MLHSPTLTRLITIFSFLLLLPPSFSKVLRSASFDCGILRNEKYPFWNNNTPKDCRLVGFQLNCAEPSPIIDIGQDGKFRLLQVNQMSYTMTLGPKDPSGYICPKNPQNRTLLHPCLKLSKFNQNIRLLYNCAPAQVTLPPENTTNSGQPKYNNIDPFVLNESVVGRNDYRELFTRGATFEIEVNQTVYQKFQNLRLVDALSGGFGVVSNVSGVLRGQCVGLGGICKSNSMLIRPNL
ncbi:hypothetical protein SLEP1_g33289 [Rubroshorea leprosula]|uniref:Wall-associated receptor kinase galacturonan-binding domain-containing protein n=1 Tax=Rubroshorea leprosula TaxID=152421 RepID=A0AAV5KG77_9ROSI|nr:hypothetical protein SLEP1_g33289 [Rubroshorea leprosula]